jgi:hypothetical protein
MEGPWMAMGPATPLPSMLPRANTALRPSMVRERPSCLLLYIMKILKYDTAILVLGFTIGLLYIILVLGWTFKYRDHPISL